MRSLDIKKVSIHMNTMMHVASNCMLPEKTYLKMEVLARYISIKYVLIINEK